MFFQEFRPKDDLEVCRKLYEEHRQKLYYIAFEILHNSADAEDAVHNGFVKLANNFGRYGRQPYKNLECLIYTIVKNAAMDIAREYERKASFGEETGLVEEDIPDREADILNQLIGRALKSDLTRALSELTPDERKLLHMRYEMGLKSEDIGAAVGTSPQNVRKRLMRVREKLEKRLETYL